MRGGLAGSHVPFVEGERENIVTCDVFSTRSMFNNGRPFGGISYARPANIPSSVCLAYARSVDAEQPYGDPIDHAIYKKICELLLKGTSSSLPHPTVDVSVISYRLGGICRLRMTCF